MGSKQPSEGTSVPNGNHAYTSPLISGLRRPGTQNGANPRPTSQTTYTPSYMSHVPTSSRTDSIAIDVPKAPTRPEPTYDEITPRGLLLVLVASEIHPSTMKCLEMLLSRQNFSGLIIAATQEQEVAVKKLKMDIFGLLGRMNKEVGVSTHFKESWSQASVEATVQEITRTGESTQGILCCPDFGPADGADVLDLDADDLEQSWKRTIGFLHAASRATVRSLLAQCKVSRNLAQEKTGRGPHGPFFLVTGSHIHALTAASQITQAACDSLLHQLETATKSEGLVVGYTENLLVPDPVDVDEPRNENGQSFQPRIDVSHADDEPFNVSESPTKLWNMWANMQASV